MWVLAGKFIRDLNDDPSLRKKPVSQVILKMIEYRGPLLYPGGKISSNRLIRLAESSTSSSQQRLDEARSHPQISQTRPSYCLSKCLVRFQRIGMRSLCDRTEPYGRTSWIQLVVSMRVIRDSAAENSSASATSPG
jgi:hypothetical protein